MKLLLDTHALIWWFENDPRLTRRARTAIASPKSAVFVSAASAWECAIKFHAGKLPQAAALITSFRPLLQQTGFELLDMSIEHIFTAGALPRFHGDPFDRMMIAQALIEKMPLVSGDEVLDPYGVRRVW